MRVPVFAVGGDPENVVRAELPVVETRYAAGSALPRHRHTAGHLIAVVSGRFDDVVGRSARQYRRASFFIRPAGQVHANTFALDARCLNIEITGFDHLASRTFESESLLGALLDAGDDLSLQSVVGEVMARLRACRAGALATRRVARARELAEDAFHTALTLESAAAEAGIPAAKLARDFRRAYGCTFGQYVRRKRVEFAVRALRESSRSLAEISAAAGFYDQSHFTNVFRQSVGMTPARFRRRRS